MECKRHLIEERGGGRVEWCHRCGAIREVGVFARTMKDGSRRMVRATHWIKPEAV